MYEYSSVSKVKTHLAVGWHCSTFHGTPHETQDMTAISSTLLVHPQLLTLQPLVGPCCIVNYRVYESNGDVTPRLLYLAPERPICGRGPFILPDSSLGPNLDILYACTVDH